MPTYEYRCLDCRHEYEKREGFDAPALQQCPKCQGSARRLIRAAPIVFKGSGFYVTDSRTSAPEADAQASVDATPSPKKDSKKSSADKDASKGSGKDASPSTPESSPAGS